jgi:hypothetical protein
VFINVKSDLYLSYSRKTHLDDNNNLARHILLQRIAFQRDGLVYKPEIREPKGQPLRLPASISQQLSVCTNRI